MSRAALFLYHTFNYSAWGPPLHTFNTIITHAVLRQQASSLEASLMEHVLACSRSSPMRLMRAQVGTFIQALTSGSNFPHLRAAPLFIRPEQ